MSDKLTVNVRSFSYRKGIPEDESGNGGGYVFDCRGILNPGRIEEYKTQTGRDKGVKTFLEEKTEMPNFLEAIKKIVDISVANYAGRGFSNLEINFGCTGGQHRSVYATDAVAKHIEEKFPQVEVKVKHVVQEEKNWINEPY